jgi:hypothetical protein
VLAERVNPSGPGSSDRPAQDSAALSERLRERRDQIDARNRQLQERVRALAERRGREPGPDEAERAREYADEALAHARDAHEQAAGCHDQAAAVHLEVADVLDRYGRGDRAQDHRVAAEADRVHAATEREAAQHDAQAGLDDRDR